MESERKFTVSFPKRRQNVGSQTNRKLGSFNIVAADGLIRPMKAKAASMRLDARQTDVATDRRATRSGVRLQVAALPVVVGDDGIARVLLLTSRETKRWVIPKGWPMKGLKPHEAAAQEAFEEAGLSGKIGKKPIGRYTYFKRREAHFDVCVVDVFRLFHLQDCPIPRENNSSSVRATRRFDRSNRKSHQSA
jgi:8-oxo-dGTP pyrophosphatase MutT (NUDIX family)